MRQAELDAEFSQREANQQREVYGGTRKREAAAKSAFDDALARSKKDPLNANDLEEKRINYQIALKESTAELARLEASMTANKQNQLSFVQKEHEYRKLMTGEMKTQLAILQEEASRSKQMAQQFGAMDSVGQRGLADAVDRFKKGGRDAVTGQELASLQQFAPDIIGKELEKSVGANPLLAYIQKQLGVRDGETINKEIGKLEATINMHVKFDETETLKSMEAVLAKLNLGDLLGRIVSDKFKLEIEQFRVQQSTGKAAN
jgi:hypothetical protein